eukprot:GEMP01004220.1.p1 GENE.GEMP01004220.1~~GEMP01004220.1.p1  ORF type:complete len:944 (+),score=160.89 GEMP01004220.1:130-2961(+)
MSDASYIKKLLAAFRASLVGLLLVVGFHQIAGRLPASAYQQGSAEQGGADPRRIRATAQHNDSHAWRAGAGTIFLTDAEIVNGKHVSAEALAAEISLETEEFQKYSISFLFGTIIILSLLFEFLHDRLMRTLEQRKMYEYLKIPRSLFKELAIFGFNGLALKVLVNSGSLFFFEQLIVAFTRPCKQVVDRLHETASEDLSKMFETIDILIFMIMFMYVGIVLVMTLLAHVVEGRWEQAEKKSLQSIQKEYMDRKGNIIERWITKTRLLREFEFHLLRREFFFPSPPMKRHKAVKPRDFRFAKFLGNCLTNLVVTMIDIPASCFLFLFVFVFAIQPLFWLDGVHLTMALMFCPWVLLGCLLVIDWKVGNIHQWILPNTQPFVRESMASTKTREEKVYCVLGDIPLDIACFQNINTKPLMFDHLRNPLRRTESTFKKFLWGTSSPTAQQNLFWFKKNGPRVLLHYLQLLLFLTSVFCAVYLKFLIPEAGYPHVPYTFQCYIFVGFTIIPLLLLLFAVFPNVLMMLTVVQNTVQMRNEKMIRHTVSQIIDEQECQYTKLISQLKLKGYVYELMTCDSKQFLRWFMDVEDYFQNVHEDEIAAMEELFRCYDTDATGNVDKAEMTRCLVAQGKLPHVAEETVNTWWTVFTRMAHDELINDRGKWIRTPADHSRSQEEGKPAEESTAAEESKEETPDLHALRSPKSMPRLLAEDVETAERERDPFLRKGTRRKITIISDPSTQFVSMEDTREQTARKTGHKYRYTRLQAHPSFDLSLPRTNPIIEPNGNVKLTEYNFYIFMVAMHIVEESRFKQLESKIERYLTEVVANGEESVDNKRFFEKLPDVCRRSELKTEQDIQELFKNVRGEVDDADINEGDALFDTSSVTSSGGVLIHEITAWLERFDKWEGGSGGGRHTWKQQVYITNPRDTQARETFQATNFDASRLLGY